VPHEVLSTPIPLSSSSSGNSTIGDFAATGVAAGREGAGDWPTSSMRPRLRGFSATRKMRSGCPGAASRVTTELSGKPPSMISLESLVTACFCKWEQHEHAKRFMGMKCPDLEISAHRSGSVDNIKGSRYYVVDGRVGDLDVDVLVLQTLGNAGDLNLDNAAQVSRRQLAEQHDIIKAIQKLRSASRRPPQYWREGGGKKGSKQT